MGKWQPELKRNQSRALLRFLICRLYDAGRGQLVGTRLTLAQGTLARKLGLSRQWIGILLARLQDAGWVKGSAPTLDGGMKGSTVFGVGRQCKRLLLLLKAKPRKSPEAVLSKLPLLKLWLGRGEEETRNALTSLKQIKGVGGYSDALVGVSLDLEIEAVSLGYAGLP